MPAIKDFFEVLQNIRESASNLSKDVDKSDKREETKADLAMLTLNFSDLKTILANLNDNDRQELEREVKELFSGKESLSEYTRDVQQILSSIKNRASSDTQVKQKIEQNIPIEHKEQHNSVSLIDSFAKLLQKIGSSSK